MALSSGNWSIAGLTATGKTGKIHENIVVYQRKKIVNLKLTMASGQWPSGGVKMPAAGAIGLVRNVDGYILMHVPAATTSARVWVLSTGLKLGPQKSILASGLGQTLQAATGTLAEKTFLVTAYGW